MVDGGIEDFLCTFVGRVYYHAGELLVPFVQCVFVHLVEIPVRQLSLHVLCRVLAAYGRDGHLHLHILEAFLKRHHTFHLLTGEAI